MIQISNLKEKTNDYFSDVPYVPMDELIDVPIVILDAVTFVNKDGLPTAAMRIAYADANGEPSEQIVKTTTHAGPIVDMLKSPQVTDLLAEGECIGATIIEKQSKNGNRKYRTFA